MTDDPKKRERKETDPNEFPHGRAHERLRQFEEQRGLEPSEIDDEADVDEAEQDKDKRRRCGDAERDASEPPGE